MTRVVTLLGDHVQCLKVAPPSVVATCALGALATGLTAVYFWVEQQSDDLDSHMPEFIGLLLLAGILYVVAVFLVERFRLGRAAIMVILASTVLFRLVLLPATPSLSDDVYRYQWDGRVQRAHLNPYLAVPSSPELSRLLNPDNPEPPGIDTPTIYPPLSGLGCCGRVLSSREACFWSRRLPILDILLGRSRFCAFTQTLHGYS
jgi:hypothetical protein